MQKIKENCFSFNTSTDVLATQYYRLDEVSTLFSKKKKKNYKYIPVDLLVQKNKNFTQELNYLYDTAKKHSHPQILNRSSLKLTVKISYSFDVKKRIHEERRQKLLLTWDQQPFPRTLFVSMKQALLSSCKFASSRFTFVWNKQQPCQLGSITNYKQYNTTIHHITLPC